MKAALLSPSEENIGKLAEALQRDELVAMPTETVYGLAANALHEKAVLKVFQAKERPQFDPLIVHHAFIDPSASLDAAERMFQDLETRGVIELRMLSQNAHRLIMTLAHRFWPGPLTLVLPKGERIPDLVTSGLNTVGLRSPRHPAARRLIQMADLPLAAPSANRFGRISPTSAGDVEKELGDRIPWILDGGTCEIGLESTVLRIGEKGEVELLRAGGIPREEIEKVIQSKIGHGRPVLDTDLKNTAGAASPGMLKSHYAPGTRLVLLESEIEKIAALPAEIQSVDSIALIAMRGDPEKKKEALEALLGKSRIEVRVLSPSGNLEEAARNLFSTLRELDESGFGLIVAEPAWTQEGLGNAINDRLSRASR